MSRAWPSAVSLMSQERAGDPLVRSHVTHTSHAWDERRAALTLCLHRLVTSKCLR